MTESVTRLSHITEPDPERWGGKGASLVRMRQLGLNVPDALLIPVMNPKTVVPTNALESRLHNLYPLVQAPNPQLPLLWSVRSAAPVSMPGMMDTVLNVGIVDTWADMAAHVGHERAVSMLRQYQHWWVESSTLMTGGGELETEEDLRAWANEFYLSLTTQLMEAVKAVYRSYGSSRAVDYRRRLRLAEDMGTAVILQAMVFGNGPGQSGTGVIFTRDPSTGADKIVGEFLPVAQGEALVGGEATPLNLSAMADLWPGVFGKVMQGANVLANNSDYPQDIEFTVDNGEVWFLQTRNMKRTGTAAVRIALDLADTAADPLDELRALRTVTESDFAAALVPAVRTTRKPDHTGLGASPGAITGHIATTQDDVESLLGDGKVPILVRGHTTPEDVPMLARCGGIVTLRGGITCHAAVLARAMNKPAVVGLGADLDFEGAAGSEITLCGSTGRVWLSRRKVVDAKDDGEVKRFIARLYAVTGAYPVAEAPVHAHTQVLDISGWYGDTPENFLARFDAAVAAIERPLIKHVPEPAQAAVYDALGPDEEARKVLFATALVRIPAHRLQDVAVLDAAAAPTRVLKPVRSLAEMVLAVGDVVVEAAPETDSEALALRHLMAKHPGLVFGMGAHLLEPGVPIPSRVYAEAGDLITHVLG